jgi:hypothetical protein
MDPISFRPTEEDQKILEWLNKKLGVGVSQIIRIAIRLLQQKEKRS